MDKSTTKHALENFDELVHLSVIHYGRSESYQMIDSGLNVRLSNMSEALEKE